jgi:hypothetical protein
MQVGQWTAQSLVDEINRRHPKRDLENRQTVDYLMGRERTRCRRNRRKALASVLQVSEAWLGGREDWPLPRKTFFDTERRLSDLPIPLNAFELLLHVGEQSPKMALLVSRLAERCSMAVTRDLNKFEPISQDSAHLAFPPEYHALSVVVGCVLQLILPARWRYRLIPLPATMTEEAFRAWSEAKPDPAEERAAEALTIAVEHIFGPWLDGSEPINYGHLADIAAGFGADPRVFLSTATRPHMIKGRDGTLYDPGDPLIPHAVVGWQKPSASPTTADIGVGTLSAGQ